MKRIVGFILLLAGCNVYQFEPVTPCAFSSSTKTLTVAAKPGKPELFLLVDKSGSMTFTTSTDPMCASCVSAPCSIAGCPTRWDGLTQAMQTFLPATSAAAHLGMVPFPIADPSQTTLQCNGAQVSDIANFGVPLDNSADTDVAGMQATANAVQSRINAITPYGGTPTGASVSSLLNYAPLTGAAGHPKFMLLLTDGVPNCDAALDPNSCTCTQGGAPCDVTVGGQVMNLCLDDMGTANAIGQLKAAGVTTIVVGFGNETLGGLGPAALQQMGVAGGFNRPCAVDADCGAGDTCSVNTVNACGKPTTACARSYYQATDAAGLASTLGTIANSIQCVDPCFNKLDAPPTDPKLLAVEFNGDDLPGPSADTWTYDAASGAVTFTGATCAKLKATDKSIPVEFRSVQAIGAGCQ